MSILSTMFSFRSFLVSDLAFSLILCLQFPSFPNTIYWRGFFPIVYSYLHYRFIVHKHVDLFLGSLFCSIDLCAFFFCATTMLLWLWHYCSVTQSCLTICDPMDCSRPDFPVLHHLLKFAQAHVHWVSDVIQSSHPVSSPSPPAFNLAQYQGVFQ